MGTYSLLSNLLHFKAPIFMVVTVVYCMLYVGPPSVSEFKDNSKIFVCTFIKIYYKHEGKFVILTIIVIKYEETRGFVARYSNGHLIPDSSKMPTRISAAVGNTMVSSLL